MYINTYIQRDLSFNKEVETIPEGISRLENLETL